MADFGCSLCPSSFDTREEMREHKGLEHYLSFTCVLCPTESYFKKSGGYVAHLLRAHKDKYLCNKAQIDSHMAATDKNLKRQAK